MPSGAWTKRTVGPYTVALVPGIDPEHGKGTATPTRRSSAWLNSAPAPTLPPDVEGHGEHALGPRTGGGPVDYTPEDHDYGYGPIVATTAAVQAVRALEHGDDRGAVAVRRWAPMIDRGPGQPHLAVIEDTPGDGDSPRTNMLQRTGVGVPTDPYARTGRRFKQWFQTVWDMHWFDPQMRPARVRNAYAGSDQPATPNGTQYDSPFPMYGTTQQTPDRFVTPQERRQPRPWDEGMTTEGLSGNPYGLRSW